MKALDTAHETWNTVWATGIGREKWTQADPEVIAAGQAVFARGGRKALDVGAGAGRHALALAQLGFAVDAVDASEASISHVSGLAAAGGLTVATRIAMMDGLPFAEGEFDFLVSYNVIYHGDGEIVRRTLEGFRRVLKPGGMLYLTMLSKRNADYGVGEEIATGTFVVPDASDDKVHPHFYCNAAELVLLLEGFELLKLEDREQRPDHWHWHAIAVKG